MATIFTISVENPDQILNVGHSGAGAVVQVQHDTTSSFSAPTDTGTVAIVSGTRSYTFYHATGGATTWYRTRYETSGGSATSDWSDPFQATEAGGNNLCSLVDVLQELGINAGTNEDEVILEKIAQVSRAIERYVGRWLAPRPSSGTTTYRFHTENGLSLHVPRGIRSITTLNIATEDQPDSGGTYTTATATDYYIDPPAVERDDGEPGYWVQFRRNATGTVAYFSDASFGAEIVGAFGPSSVPPDIQGVAIRSVVRRYLSKGAGGAAIAVGPNGTEFLLADMSGADRGTLDSYRRWRIG